MELEAHGWDIAYGAFEEKEETIMAKERCGINRKALS